MPDRDSEANEFFLKALEISIPEERERFLDEVCLGKPGLRDRVVGLLRSNAEAFCSLEIPAIASPADDRGEVSEPNATWSIGGPGTKTGSESISADVSESVTESPLRYIIGEEIAHGGMGIVYHARDSKLMRDVAIKVLQSKYAISSTIVRRFTDEAQISSQLQHPAIPPIHDLGILPDGRPFLVMKLIKGETLEHHLSIRRDAGDDRGRFVAIFEQICHAIAFAHSHRVIHRDLKPANIMVGKFGEVQVMDWGLAKVLSENNGETQDDDPNATSARTEIQSIRDSDGTQTQAGSVLGTPAFMPPEQAAGAIGQIDKRSDVFGLGSILAVILTGKPPFVGITAESTRILAAQGKVADCLSRLDASGADPELVSLAKHCLAALREDRPNDASVVATSVSELRSAADERARQAEIDRVRMEGERANAEIEAREQRKRRRAWMALGFAVAMLVVGGLAFAWWQDRQAMAQKSRISRNAELTLALLEQSEEALKADDPDRAEGTLTQSEERMSDGGVDNSRERLHRLRKDLTLLRELDRIDDIRWTHVNGRYPEPGTLAALWAAAFARYGIVPGKTPVEEARTLLLESAIRYRALAALDRWLLAVRSADVAEILALVDADPFRADIRRSVQINDVGRFRELSEEDEALNQPAWFVPLTHQIVQVGRRRVILERMLANNPGNLTLLMDLGDLNRMNQRTGAEERVRWYQAAVSSHPRNLAAWNMLGAALSDSGDPDGAITCYKVAIKLNPNDPHPHDNLGIILHSKNDWDGAIACYKKAIQLNPDLAVIHNNLGWTLKAKNDREGAIACFKESIRLEPKFAPAHNNLGSMLLEKGQVEAAIVCIKEALRCDPKFANAHCNLGLALNDKNDVQGAIASFKEAIHFDPKYAVAHSNLGNMLNRLDDPEGAIACYKQAIHCDPKFAIVHANMGWTLYLKGDVKGAIPFFKEAISQDPKLAIAHNRLGMALKDIDDMEGALACFKEAIHRAPQFALAHNNLGNMLNKLGDPKGAIACYKQAIHCDPKLAIAHSNLGWALLQQGELTGCIESLNSAVLHEPNNPQFRRILSQVKYWQSLIPRLDEVAARRSVPKSPIEAGELALLCMQPFRRQYATGARLYGQAFLGDPDLVQDLNNEHRYNAACCASLAGCGKGTDAPGDADARLAFRREALAWLRADLSFRTSQAKAIDSRTQRTLPQQMNHWLNDNDLAGVRPGTYHIQLSASEKANWDDLWDDVRAMIDPKQKPTTSRSIAPMPRVIKKPELN